MKQRNGFVSNSSSSSFIIIGFKLDTEQTSKLLKEGHQNTFGVVETSTEGLYIGKVVAHSDIGDADYKIAGYEEDAHLKAAAAFLDTTVDEAHLYAGSYER